MAKMVLTSTFLSLNGVDRSNNVRKAELVIEVEEKDVTTYGSLGWKEHLGGLKAGTLSIEFITDFAASALDSTMWALLGTVTTFAVRPTSSAVGAGNPSYSGSVLINAWNPIEGSVGDEATVSVSYPTSGVVTRAPS